MPQTARCDQSPFTPTQKEISARVRVDTSRVPSIEYSLAGRLRRWYRNSLLRLLVLEVSNLSHRIGWIREIRAVEHGGGKDSIRDWIGQSLVPAVYTSAYISHMQQMETHHPFLSTFDLFLLSRTWKAGLEYGIHTGTLQSRDKSCNQFSQVPDAGADTSSHSGGHAQG